MPDTTPPLKDAVRKEAEALIREWKLCGNSIRAYARSVGVHHSTASSRLDKAMRVLGIQRAALAPVAEPEGYVAGKSTVQYDAQGNVVHEWRRLHPDARDIEEWVRALSTGLPRARRIPSPPKRDGDLLEVCVGDHHFGMLSWGKETGADYDCRIAETLMVAGVDTVVCAVPSVSKILLVVMGDYYHSDTRSAQTERGKHHLDVDGRFARTAKTGVRALVAAVSRAALKAPVELIILKGNHDWHSSTWLAMLLEAYFRDSPHITIRTDPAERQYYVHGSVLLGYQHGDLTPPAALPGVMAQEQREAWAAAKWGCWHLCHHHSRIRHMQRDLWEKPGVVVEYVPTLVASDAWSAGQGYIHNRAIASYLWSSRWGLRARFEHTHDEVLEHAKQIGLEGAP